jgi:hypothetical protein
MQVVCEEVAFSIREDKIKIIECGILNGKAKGVDHRWESRPFFEIVKDAKERDVLIFDQVPVVATTMVALSRSLSGLKLKKTLSQVNQLFSTGSEMK